MNLPKFTGNQKAQFRSSTTSISETNCKNHIQETIFKHAKHKNPQDWNQRDFNLFTFSIDLVEVWKQRNAKAYPSQRRAIESD